MKRKRKEEKKSQDIRKVSIFFFLVAYLLSSMSPTTYRIREPTVRVRRRLFFNFNYFPFITFFFVFSSYVCRRRLNRSPSIRRVGLMAVDSKFLFARILPPLSLSLRWNAIIIPFIDLNIREFAKNTYSQLDLTSTIRSETWDDHYDNAHYLFVSIVWWTFRRHLWHWHAYNTNKILSCLHVFFFANWFTFYATCSIVQCSSAVPVCTAQLKHAHNNICERKLKSCFVRKFEIYVTQGSNVLIRPQHTIMTAALMNTIIAITTWWNERANNNADGGRKVKRLKCMPCFVGVSAEKRKKENAWCKKCV